MPAKSKSQYRMAQAAAAGKGKSDFPKDLAKEMIAQTGKGYGNLPEKKKKKKK